MYFNLPKPLPSPHANDELFLDANRQLLHLTPDDSLLSLNLHLSFRDTPVPQLTTSLACLANFQKNSPGQTEKIYSVQARGLIDHQQVLDAARNHLERTASKTLAVCLRCDHCSLVATPVAICNWDLCSHCHLMLLCTQCISHRVPVQRICHSCVESAVFTSVPGTFNTQHRIPRSRVDEVRQKCEVFMHTTLLRCVEKSTPYTQ